MCSNASEPCAHCSAQTLRDALSGEDSANIWVLAPQSRQDAQGILASEGWSFLWTGRPYPGYSSLYGPSNCILGPKHPVHHKGIARAENKLGTLSSTIGPPKELLFCHQPAITDSQSWWAGMVSSERQLAQLHCKGRCSRPEGLEGALEQT